MYCEIDDVFFVKEEKSEVWVSGVRDGGVFQ